jgi:hypothetical protein
VGDRGFGLRTGFGSNLALSTDIVIRPNTTAAGSGVGVGQGLGTNIGGAGFGTGLGVGLATGMGGGAIGGLSGLGLDSFDKGIKLSSNPALSEKEEKEAFARKKKLEEI